MSESTGDVNMLDDALTGLSLNRRMQQSKRIVFQFVCL